MRFNSYDALVTSKRIDTEAFRELLDELSRAWAACDAPRAALLFTSEAVYMEPPDVQLFHGTTQLEAYFSPLTPGTFLEWHGVWFDEPSQTGAGEFSFGVTGAETADHGMVMIEIENGRIRTWREYPRKGPRSFREFSSVAKPSWQWHAGNYP